ncbi:MAG: DUF2779 domain-containing protein [Planctomycetota bacterium]
MKTKPKAQGQPRFDKQLFEAGHQCLKRLYLDYHTPSDETESESRRTMSETGKQLLSLARSAFARGIEVEGKDFDARAKKTAELLASGTAAALFGAAFTADGCEVSTDILVRQKDGSLDIFEVKSGTKVKGRYLTDLALQMKTIERAGHVVRGMFVLHLDKTYKHQGGTEYTPTGLIKSADVSERVRRFAPRVAEEVQRFVRQLSDDSVLELPTGTFCTSPFPCPHLEQCMQKEPEFPLRLLPDLTHQLENELHEEGVADLAQLDPDRPGFTFRQRRTLQSVREGSMLIEPFVKEELLQIEFPLHFLSIATLTEPLPRFAGQKPWQPTPFAWACETLTENGKLLQSSFAWADKEDPRPEFIRSLQKQLAAGGMLILWNADSMECVRLLLDSLPTEKQAIRVVLARPHLDLQRLLESGLFHPQLLSTRDLASTARVITNAEDIADQEIIDEDSMRRALQKAATPRVRSATKEKIGKDLQTYVSTQASMLLGLYRQLSGHPLFAGDVPIEKPQKKTVGPRKQLPPKPVEE